MDSAVTVSLRLNVRKYFHSLRVSRRALAESRPATLSLSLSRALALAQSRLTPPAIAQSTGAANFGGVFSDFFLSDHSVVSAKKEFEEDAFDTERSFLFASQSCAAFVAHF